MHGQPNIKICKGKVTEFGGGGIFSLFLLRQFVVLPMA